MKASPMTFRYWLLAVLSICQLGCNRTMGDDVSASAETAPIPQVMFERTWDADPAAIPFPRYSDNKSEPVTPPDSAILRHVKISMSDDCTIAVKTKGKLGAAKSGHNVLAATLWRRKGTGLDGGQDVRYVVVALEGSAKTNTGVVASGNALYLSVTGIGPDTKVSGRRLKAATESGNGIAMHVPKELLEGYELEWFGVIWNAPQASAGFDGVPLYGVVLPENRPAGTYVAPSLGNLLRQVVLQNERID